MESDDDASSFKSFSEEPERPVAASAGSSEIALGGAGSGTDTAASAPSEEAAPSAEVRASAAQAPRSEFDYDESLPDGSSFRRRRRSVMEADELPDEKKDLDAALAFKSEGNRHFGEGDHDTAAACYTEALRHLPRDAASSDGHRSICYANRGACHFAAGRLHDAVYDCDRALEYNGSYAKALARRAAVLEKLGKLEEAARDLGRLVELEPGNRTAREGIARLEAAVKERDEKLKTEMLDKLKGLGNTILGKFGLSLDNFKAVQDPATGSYSISFQR